MAFLLALLVACRDNGRVVITGVVVGTKDPNRGVSLVLGDSYPDDLGGTPLSDVTVKLANSLGEESIVKTDEDGRFTVQVSVLEGKVADVLEFTAKGHHGVTIEELEVRDERLALKRGRNVLVVRLPPTACPLPARQAEADQAADPTKP